MPGGEKSCFGPQHTDLAPKRQCDGSENPWPRRQQSQSGQSNKSATQIKSIGSFLDLRHELYEALPDLSVVTRVDAPAPWWTPARHSDRRSFLQARTAVTRASRAWFEARGFVEVETGILQVSPGNETHLHAPSTEVTLPSGERRTRYFRTSPEFACKKLLAAGEARIVEFARVFRDREQGDLHLPEFTMLEWYRAGAPYEIVIDDCIGLIAQAARTTGRRTFSFRGGSADPLVEPERLTVAEAFRRYADLDLLATVVDGRPDRAALAAAASRCARVADDDTWSDIFSKVLVGHIEPKLGQGRLTVLSEYPAPEAALARVKRSDPRVAERFEIYACGVELANGFAELTDAREQRSRFMEAMDEKERRYGERYPLDEEFLAAVAQMPSASGVALGFDRLVMLATGASRVDQVVWTPPEAIP
jgi:elongation factor P--(R)-beta-lysine ligase